MIQIDPHAWVVTLPITIALVQLFFQPAHHPLRKMLKNVALFEAEAWSRLTYTDAETAAARSTRVGRLVHRFATVCMATATLASFGTFAGLPLG